MERSRIFFLSSKKVWTHKTSFSVYMVGNLIYSELRNLFCSDVGAEYFAKGTENFKIVRNFFKKEKKNLVYHACRKTQELGESDK